MNDDDYSEYKALESKIYNTLMFLTQEEIMGVAMGSLMMIETLKPGIADKVVLEIISKRSSLDFPNEAN